MASTYTWPLVKHLDDLWLIFLNQYPFGRMRQASNLSSKHFSNPAQLTANGEAR